jgi:hypothetical protein
MNSVRSCHRQTHDGENYASILTAWELLKQFTGQAEKQDPSNFTEDLLGEMNEHIADTDGIRLPWVWIMEILLSEAVQDLSREGVSELKSSAGTGVYSNK